MQDFWLVDFRVTLPSGERTRIREVSPTPGRRAAEDYEHRRRGELLTPPPPPEAQEVKPELPTLKTFAAEFLCTYVKANNAPSEQAGKRCILDKHLLPRFGDKRLDEIGARDLEAMKAELQATHKPATVNHILTVLRKLLSYAVDVEILDKVPRFRLVKVPPQPFDFLDFEQYGQLLEALGAESELLCAVLLAGDAGLRRGEVAGLKWQDINFALGKLTVMRSIWGAEEKAPKGGKARGVPLTSRLTRALKRHRHLGAYVLMRDGAPWTNEVFRWQGQRAYRLGGVPAVRMPWHCLRHTFCSHLAMRGAPVKAIQELAGHSELTTTLRYMHLSPAALTQAIGLLEADGSGQPVGQPESRSHVSGGKN